MVSPVLVSLKAIPPYSYGKSFVYYFPFGAADSEASCLPPQSSSQYLHPNSGNIMKKFKAAAETIRDAVVFRQD
jgi:hypothetical protein